MSSDRNTTGTLGETRVQDVLSEVERTARDGRVWFETDFGMAEVHFSKGRMIKARLGGARGQTALLRLLGVTEGRYGVESCSVADETPLIANVASLTELHATRQAEWNELCGHAPPLSCILRLTSTGADVRDSSRGIQRVILVLIDGRRTLMQVLEESSFDPVEALRIVTKGLDDDLIRIAPQATSLFPLAPAGDSSGVLPRFPSSSPVPGVQARVDVGPPTWRHATLVGVGAKPAAAKATGGLSPAPIIDLERRGQHSETLGTDALRTGGVGSLVKTVIQGFGANHEGTSSSHVAEVVGRDQDARIRRAIRNNVQESAPRQRIVDISPDDGPRQEARAKPTSLSSEYPADASGPKPEGQRRYIDRYEVLLRIGRGGMGTVYLARLTSEDVGFRRLYAIKLLRSHLSLDTQAARDFIEEARIAGCLHHANVVAVHDAGFHGKQPYLVMEYVEGCSLKHLTSRPISPSPYFLVPIIIDALAGLQAAHVLQDELGNDLNLVHCDVSPENMLIGVDGTCRLTDFGMARRASQLLGATTRGKPGYVAPECITGSSFDRRADIFSMGVVLWNALTGKRLFSGDTVDATIAQVCNKAIVPPSAEGAQSSRELDDVVMRALSRNVNERFDSAEEMLTALGRIASRDGGLANPKEIAAWVRESAGVELSQRRLAILDAYRSTPTIPPPRDDREPVRGLAHPTNPPVERQFRSSSSPPTVHEVLQPSTVIASIETKGAEEFAAPPSIGLKVQALFYGADAIPTPEAAPKGPSSVKLVAAPSRAQRLRRVILNPWVLVVVLALIIAAVVLTLKLR